MAEPRKKTAHILLTLPGKTPVSLELFPAELWPGQPGAVAGVFRVRQGGRWVRVGGEKYSFLPPAAVGGLVARLLGGLSGDAAPAEELRPELPVGTPVRVVNGGRAPDGTPLYDRTRTATQPHQGADGCWYVHVLLFGRGLVQVPVSECRR